MGGSSKQQKQSSTQTSSPPAWAMPLFRQGAKDAQNFYQSGQGGNVYQGQRVADLSRETQSGLQGLQQALSGFGNNALQSRLGQPTAAQSNLADMASGSYLQQGNPYYRERLNEAANEMAAKVNSQMSGAGRYGSGANSNILAKNTAAMMVNGLNTDYDRAMQNMLAANGQIDSANQGALNSAGNYLRNWSGAAEAQMQGGRVVDDNAQDKLAAAQQKWEEEDNKGWRRLGYLQDAAKGLAGNYGTQTSKSSTSMSDRNNPWNMVGSLGGLTRKSDRRAKENIIPAGCKNGFPLYEFNYKGEKQRWRGVMAQDVLRLKPEAVTIDAGDGLYCVDYGQLGFEPQKLAEFLDRAKTEG
ncbi:tail fiber domain-containing protein [Candidatus Tokpelaia sp.]|uniref:tail fiber domain-containing protein n=1 Tax=Candidatus Tokpelaia sp. TaxID=2233777 RepID=UPI001239AD25|nr:tail fiber domain-containing protein [Candidatus Tokpelaia sp.]KAA6404614.1 tail fiber domain-containing protein [Candidatus Tokpelaia sp.]